MKITTTYPPNSQVPMADRKTLWHLRGNKPAPEVVTSPRLNRFTTKQRAHALWSIRRPMEHWTPHPHRPMAPTKPNTQEET